MNTTKAGSYGKLIAFFLVAVIVLCAFGFAVEGWQVQDNNHTSGNFDNGIANGNTNKPTDTDTPVGQPSEPQKPTPPQYTDAITGLEISVADSALKHLCFAIDSNSPLYGLNSVQLMIEIPIENDKTRYLVFTNPSATIGKIGSITNTRAYISNLAKSFNSVLISLGSDDKTSYQSADVSGMHFDLSKNAGYSYSEYSKYNYSNGELIGAGLTNVGISTLKTTAAQMPYAFADFYADEVNGNMPAQSVTLPYSMQTQLSYSSANKTYVISKNGSTKLDTLSDTPLEFKNVFVLFADSVTYEDENGSEMVMNTTGNGKGIYITNATAKNITWISDAAGNLSFFDENGQTLVVNRGTSYIGFVKSAKLSEVKFS